MKYDDIELSNDQLRRLIKNTDMKHHELADETGYEPASIAAMSCGARKVSKRVVRYFQKHKKQHLKLVLDAECNEE